MNNLTVFSFKSNEIRTVIVNDEPWFVAKDVCNILDIKNVSMAINGNENTGDLGIDEDEKLIYKILISGQKRDTIVINESGLYSLVFKSKKHEAKEFRKWVTREVLPSIRKTGQYSSKIDNLIDQKVERLFSKRIRLSLSDAIEQTDLNNKMHGWGYKNITDFVYKLVLGVNCKKYKEQNNIDGNLRDSLDTRQLKLISHIENVVKDLVLSGLDYDQIKDFVSEYISLDKIEEINIKRIQ